MRGLSLGIGAALAAVALGPVYGERIVSHIDRPRLGPWDDEDRFIPNDHGPVIDSTPESKRARRRRIAREAKS